MSKPLALEVAYDPSDGLVHCIGESWDAAASWGCVLEGIGEEVEAGAIASLSRVCKDYDGHGRDLHRVIIEDAKGNTETRYWLVGDRPRGVSRDWDAVRDAEMDR